MTTCKETKLVLCMVIMICVIIFAMYMMNRSKSTEGFDDTELSVLISQYDSLSTEDKAKLANIIGTPVNQADMIHKSAVPPQRECPASRFNELDYVKRSSIPPYPEPQACIAPKVVIDSELCKKQDCPPCPKPDATLAKVVTKRVPVFITKTVTVDEDGNVLKETMDKSEDGDLDLAEELITSGSTTPTRVRGSSMMPEDDTTVSNPTNPSDVPEPEATEQGFWSRVGDFFTRD